MPPAMTDPNQVSLDNSLADMDETYGGYEEAPPLPDLAPTGEQMDLGFLNQEWDDNWDDVRKELYYRTHVLGISPTPQSAASDAKQIMQQNAQAKAQSGKPITSTEVKSLSDLDSVSFTLDAIESKLNAIKQRGPIVGRARQMSPYDTDAREVENLVTSIVPGLARGVFGEVGVLTDQDIKRYRELIPNMTTSPEVAERNISNLRQKIANSRKEKLETMKQAGFDVSGFEQQSQPAAAPAAPKFEVGKPYRDNQGRVGIYKGNDASGRPIFEESK